VLQVQEAIHKFIFLSTKSIMMSSICADQGKLSILT